MQQFNNLHLNDLFDGKPQTESKITINSTKLYKKYDRGPYPNYITIPRFETAYGFTSNDTIALNTVVDPWDFTLIGGQSQNEERKNRHFFHALGEIQRGKLSSAQESIDEVTRNRDNSSDYNKDNSSSNYTENTTNMETYFKRSVTSVTNTSSLQSGGLTTTQSNFKEKRPDSTDNSSMNLNKTLHKRQAFVKMKTIGDQENSSSIESESHLLNKTHNKRSVTYPHDIIDLNRKVSITSISSTQTITCENSSTEHSSPTSSASNISKPHEVIPNSVCDNPTTDTGLNVLSTLKIKTNNVFPNISKSATINETDECRPVENENNYITTEECITSKSKVIDALNLKENVSINLPKEELFNENKRSNISDNCVADAVKITTTVTILENNETNIARQYDKTEPSSDKSEKVSCLNTITDTSTSERAENNKPDLVLSSTLENILVNEKIFVVPHPISKTSDEKQNLIANEKLPDVRIKIDSIKGSKVSNATQKVPANAKNQTLITLGEFAVDSQNKIVFTCANNHTIISERNISNFKENIPSDTVETVRNHTFILESSVSNLKELKGNTCDVPENESIPLSITVNETTENHTNQTLSTTLENTIILTTAEETTISAASEEATKSNAENTYLYLTNNQINKFKNVIYNKTLQSPVICATFDEDIAKDNAISLNVMTSTNKRDADNDAKVLQNNTLCATEQKLKTNETCNDITSRELTNGKLSVNIDMSTFLMKNTLIGFYDFHVNQEMSFASIKMKGTEP